METKKVTPLFFFLSLATVVTLIMSVTAFLSLAFETLNHVLPDVLTDSYQYGYMTYSYEGMRSAMALLIIIFPIFLILEHFWSVAGRAHDLYKGNLVLRRWALYLILFLAGAVIATDLVLLVRYFVSGELTLRFVLKVLLALALSAKIGWYYIRELTHKKRYWWMSIGVSALVVALIVWSFTVTGSPVAQRMLRIDQRRVDDLQSIQWQVISYWQQKETLPTSLMDLANPISNYMLPRDPEFQKGMIYEYSKTGPKSFELCATFARPLPKGWVPGQGGGGVVYPASEVRDAAVSAVAPYPGVGTDSWDHEAGRACFSRTIDPDLYPPYPKQVKE